MKLQELMDQANNLSITMYDLVSESHQQISGWHHVDKLRMKEILQSMYHMCWTLTSLFIHVSELTGAKVLDPNFHIDDIRYHDFDDLTPAILTSRFRNWYDRVTQFQQLYRSILVEARAMGAKPTVSVIMCSRLKLDLEFLTQQATFLLEGQ